MTWYANIGIRRAGQLVVVASVLAGNVLCCALVGKADIETGLMGHWRLDEANGSTATDSSPLGNHGVYENGAVAGQPGVLGNAAQFNGSWSRVNAGDDASLEVSSGLSIAAWIKPYRFKSPYGGIIVNKEGEYEIAVWTDGSIRWALANSNPGWAWINTGYVVPTDRWTHVTLTYDGTHIKTYVNGALVHTYTGSGQIGDAHTPENELWIGARSAGGGHGQDFDGLIDEVRVYNRHLVQEDVTELHSGLIGHWKFNESSGTTAVDSSAHENDGTYTNGPTLGSLGVRGGAASFNLSGTDDRVDLPNTVLDGAMDASVAFWIKTKRTGQISVLSGADSGHNNEFLVYLSNHTSLYLYKHNSSYGVTIPSIADDKWQHFAITWKGTTNTVTFYRNGELHGSGVMGGSTGVPINIDPGGLMVAQEQDCVGGCLDSNQIVAGSLDDLRIYNRALKPEEIGPLYGLVGRWKLDETSGTVAVDASGASNDGTFINSPTLGVPGVYSGATEFNGSSQYVQVPGDPSLDFTEAVTVSCWAKSDSDTWNTYGMLVSKRNQFVLHPQSGSKVINWYVYIDGTGWRSVSYDPSTNGKNIRQWHHYAGTYDSVSGTLALYVDGLPVASTTYGGPLPSDSGPMAIGRDDGISRYFDGCIDDVRVYDRALDASEFTQPERFVAHWKLDDGSGATAADATGNGFDGSLNGGPTWTTGPRNGALRFNGINDYIKVDDASAFDVLGELSVAFWINIDRDATNSEMRIFSKKDRWDGDSGYEILYDPATRNLFFGGTDSNQLVAQGIDLIGGWHHVAVTIGSYGGGQYRGRMYLDGKEITINIDSWDGFASQNLVPNQEVNPLVENDLPIGIGSRSPDNAGKYLDGLLDDIRVFDRVLSDSEIASFYGFTGHWKLDETSGTTAADSSGATNDGTYVNDPSLGDPGARGNAASFNLSDTNDRLDLPNTVLDGAKDASVAFWVKTTRTGQTSILSGANSGYNNEFLIYLSNHTTIYLYKHNSAYGVTIPSIADGKWQHYVITWRGASNTVTFYRNGQLLRSGVMSGPTGLPIAIDPGGLVVAQEQDSVGGSFDPNQILGGSLDDLRIYTRVLSAQEIAGLFGIGGHWRLDSGSGTIAVDSSGFENDGAYQNGPSLGQNAIRGYGARFNGTNGRVEIPDAARYSTHTTTGLTVTAWVKVHALGTDSHGQTRQPIVAKGNASSREWALYIYDNGAPGFSTWTAGGGGHSEITSSTHTISIETWAHVAATFQDGVANRVYLNGEEVVTGTSFSGNAHDGDQPVLIGARGDGQYLNATIDDVRIYSRVMSHAEILELVGLVGHWRLDETSGFTATDSSGLGNDGSYFGGPYLDEDGVLRRAVAFRGFSDYVNVSASESLDLSDSLTVACWAKSNTKTWNTYGMLVSKRNQFVMHPSSGSKVLQFYVYRDGLGWTATQYDLANIEDFDLTGWHHYAGTYDPVQGTLALYVDSQLVSSIILTSPLAGDEGPLTIARDEGLSRFFDGKMDDVRVYNRALLQSEIAELYGLMGYWKLDEGGGLTATDASGFGNHGDLYGGPQWLDEAHDGGGLHFDGISDYVEVADSQSLDITGEFSISLWMKVASVDENPWMRVISKKSSETAGSGYEIEYHPGQGRLTFGGTGRNQLIAFGVHLVGPWRHVVATVSENDDGTYKGRFYVDGIEVVDDINSWADYSAGTKLPDQQVTPLVANDLSLGIGSFAPPVSGARFDGDLDDVRIFNRAILPEEVVNFYGGGPKGIRIIKWIEVR